jgi:Spy/CpxP family protein refolding chaperone
MSGTRLFSSASLTVLMSAFLLAPCAVQAQPRLPGSAMQQDPTAVYAKAGANPDQIAKIRTLGKAYEDTAKVRFQRMINLQTQMRELLIKPSPDEKAVLAKQEEINKIVAEMSNERVKLMLHIRGTLTPEQKQKLVEMQKTPPQQGR